MEILHRANEEAYASQRGKVCLYKKGVYFDLRNYHDINRYLYLKTKSMFSNFYYNIPKHNKISINMKSFGLGSLLMSAYANKSDEFNKSIVVLIRSIALLLMQHMAWTYLFRLPVKKGEAI